MNTKDDDNFSPRSSPILYDELSVVSSVGCPPPESEGDEYFSPLPTPAQNIAPEVVTPPNTSIIGYTTPEGSDTLRQHQPYQQKQWLKSVW